MFHSFPFSYLEEAISCSLNIPSTGYLFQGQAVPPQAGAAHSTSRPQAERQVYDQFQLSIQPSGEETRMKELVGRISQEIRIRPTCREIEYLQAQIREGRYQPDPQEIAARMLLQKGAD